MAKKDKPKSAPYRGYIPVYLDDKSKKAVKANLGSDTDYCDRFSKYAEDDYRVTLAWDTFNECYSASLYDTSIYRPSGGYILAAKHSDLRVAVATLIYLHEKVYPDGWDIERAGQQADVNW